MGRRRHYAVQESHAGCRPSPGQAFLVLSVPGSPIAYAVRARERPCAVPGISAALLLVGLHRVARPGCPSSAAARGRHRGGVTMRGRGMACAPGLPSIHDAASRRPSPAFHPGRFPDGDRHRRPQAGQDVHYRQSFMTNYFDSPFKGKLLSEQVTNPNIKVGRYSYYSGYYHGHSFDDCARYLLPDREDVDQLVIGSFCSIGSGASFIMAGNQGHRHDWVSSFPFFYMQEEPAFASAQDAFQRAGDTVLGSDVWVGSEAMIMPGVRIGHGAVIGSRALVTRDVEPYAIVGGNPGRPIRKRFSDAQIALLLEMAWWDWPIDWIEAAMPLLCTSDIAGLHAYWRGRAV